jgi:hypothetical protein
MLEAEQQTGSLFCQGYYEGSHASLSYIYLRPPGGNDRVQPREIGGIDAEHNQEAYSITPVPYINQNHQTTKQPTSTICA